MKNLFVIILVSFSFLAFTQHKTYTEEQKKAIELLNLGNEKIGYKSFEEAIIHYTAALVHWPEFKEAYKNRGICYALLKNNIRAIEDYKKALALDSLDPYLHNFHGFAMAEIAFEKNDYEHFEKAISEIDKAITLNPEYTEAYVNKGIISLWLDKVDDAISLFDKAISLNGNNSKAYYNRGICHHKKGSEARACIDWSKARTLNYPLAGNMISQYCE